MDQVKVLCEGSYRKEAFFDHKNIGLKITKISIFSMGLVHGFMQKWRFFNLMFLCKMDQEKVLCEGS